MSAPAERAAPAARRRPGLRGLPGGYDLARLPLAVPPAASEHAGSWLTRLAHRYALTPHGLLSAVGLATPSYNLRAMQRHLHRHAEQAGRLLGAPPPSRAPDDARCLDTALAGYQAGYGSGAGRWPSGSRFCPACQASTAISAGSSAGTGAGVWSASWLSPLLGVCLTHQVLLVPCCPRCGQVPWSSPAWTARCGPGWTCPERLPAPARPPGQRATAAGRGQAGRSAGCGQDLREVPASPASERDVQVQQLLVQVARRAAEDPDGGTFVCGVDSTHQEYLHGLLELVVESRRGAAGLWRLGSDVRLLLDSAGVAVAVLTEPDSPAAVRLAEQHGLLSPAGRCTTTGPDSVLRRRPHNDLLAAVRLGVLNDTGGLSPTAQLTFRTGSGRPRYPQPGVRCAHQDAAARPGQLPLRAVPQVLWPGLLTDHLLIDVPEQLAPDRHQDEHGDLVLGRACAAMFLARLGSTRPWRLIAIELGLPAWFAGIPLALHRRLVERGRWPAFLTDLDALATRLRSHLELTRLRGHLVAAA